MTKFRFYEYWRVLVLLCLSMVSVSSFSGSYRLSDSHWHHIRIFPDERLQVSGFYPDIHSETVVEDALNRYSRAVNLFQDGHTEEGDLLEVVELNWEGGVENKLNLPGLTACTYSSLAFIDSDLEFTGETELDNLGRTCFTFNLKKNRYRTLLSLKGNGSMVLGIHWGESHLRWLNSPLQGSTDRPLFTNTSTGISEEDQHITVKHEFWIDQPEDSLPDIDSMASGKSRLLDNGMPGFGGSDKPHFYGMDDVVSDIASIIVWHHQTLFTTAQGGGTQHSAYPGHGLSVFRLRVTTLDGCDYIIDLDEHDLEMALNQTVDQTPEFWLQLSRGELESGDVIALYLEGVLRQTGEWLQFETRLSEFSDKTLALLMAGSLSRIELPQGLISQCGGGNSGSATGAGRGAGGGESTGKTTASSTTSGRQTGNIASGGASGSGGAGRQPGAGSTGQGSSQVQSVSFEQALKQLIERFREKFSQSLDTGALYTHLMVNGACDDDTLERISAFGSATSREKIQLLLNHLKKNPEGLEDIYRKFFLSLQQEQEHMGHSYLVDLVITGLQEYGFNPDGSKFSQSSSSRQSKERARTIPVETGSQASRQEVAERERYKSMLRQMERQRLDQQRADRERERVQRERERIRQQESNILQGMYVQLMNNMDGFSLAPYLLSLNVISFEQVLDWINRSQYLGMQDINHEIYTRLIAHQRSAQMLLNMLRKTQSMHSSHSELAATLDTNLRRAGVVRSAITVVPYETVRTGDINIRGLVPLLVDHMDQDVIIQVAQEEHLLGSSDVSRVWQTGAGAPDYQARQRLWLISFLQARGKNRDLLRLIYRTQQSPGHNQIVVAPEAEAFFREFRQQGLTQFTNILRPDSQRSHSQRSHSQRSHSQRSRVQPTPTQAINGATAMHLQVPQVVVVQHHTTQLLPVATVVIEPPPAYRETEPPQGSWWSRNSPWRR